MNGAKFTEAHATTLKALAGLFSDADIGNLTGHAAITIRIQRKARGLPSYHPANRVSRYSSLTALPTWTRMAIKAAC